jgi:hypothetical protein
MINYSVIILCCNSRCRPSSRRSTFTKQDVSIVIRYNSTSFNKSKLKAQYPLLTKRYIFGYLKYYVNKFKCTKPYFIKFLKSVEVINYFKRFHPFQRLVRIEKYLSKSPYYDIVHIDKVNEQNKVAKDLFISNLGNITSLMQQPFIPKISEREHAFGIVQVLSRAFGYFTTDFRPTLEFVISQINFKASSGLPEPWLSKRVIKYKLIKVLHSIYDNSINLRDLDANEFEVVPLSAAFVRLQITNSGLKARLVFAVSYYFICVETYFNCILKYVIDRCKSCCIHGYTQKDISNLVTKTKNRHVLCIDYKQFDAKVPSFVIASIAHCCVLVCKFNIFEKRLFLDSVAWFITSPVFHPTLQFKEKERGIPSGSGYTSIFGSLCNLYMLSIALRRYCYQNKIVLREPMFDIYVSSDDTIISTSFRVDFTKFAKILTDSFDVEIELESQSQPGVDHAFFLGSEWIDGKPFRNVNRMFARILFGSGNLPQMSDLSLFQSRCFEILGNVHDFHDIYKTFRVPYPERIFRQYELMDYTNRSLFANKRNKLLERRGFWEEVLPTY